MTFRSIKILASLSVVLFSISVQLQAQDANQTKIHVGTTQKIGDVVLFTLPIATIGTSIIIGDKKGTWQFTKGLLLTAGVTYGLKYTINKQRPDMSNANSFPSGHTSTTFHSAGYIHRRYGFKYSIPAYALAGFTAASRVDSKKHDALDVLAGAVIGLGSNLLFTTKHQQEYMELTFNNIDGDYLLGFTCKF